MIRLLRLLLHVLPPRFRAECGDAILDLHAARDARLRGALPARVALCGHTAADILRTAAAEWLEMFAATDTPAARAASDVRRMTVTDRFRRELRDAVRRLGRTPGFSLSAIAILAVGLGGTIAMFSAVDAFVLRPRPFAHPDRLVNVYQDSDDGRPSSSSYPAYLDVTAMTPLFEGVGATMPEGTATLLTEAGDTRPVHVEYATSTYFPVLGLAPAQGRWFDGAEDVAGGPLAGVVGYRTWQQRFGADPAILGRTVRLSGASVTIVGIGPRGFDGYLPGLSTEFWLSISSLGPVGGAFRARTLTRREDHWFQIVARLGPGVSIDAARAALGALAARLQREFPETDRDRGISVLPVGRVRAHPDIDAVLYPAAGVYAVLAGLVLLAVCTNLATLLLARGDARRREFGVRLALGASRGAIVASLFLESVLLSLAGCAGGLLLASWILELIGTVDLPLPVAIAPAVAIDGRAATFAAAVSLACAVAFGLLPALGTTRRVLVTSIREGRSPDAGFRWRRLGLRGALVAVQVAVSLALLTAGGVLLRSAINATHVDLGFTGERLAVMTVDAAQAGHRGADGAATLTGIADRVGALPGIEAVALASRIPLTPFGPSNTLVLDDTAALAPADRTVEVESAVVTPGYFDVLGLPVVHGRAFTDADVATGEPVAIVSLAMAREFWGAADVVGRRFRYEGDPASWVRIVGVSANAPIQSPGETPRPFAYRPTTQLPLSAATVIARTSVPPAEVAAAMRAAVRGVDPLIPVIQPGTMQSHVDRSMAVPRAATQALGGLGGLAIVLAAFGVYSVVAFNVAKRRGEMGVRMAVGATRAQVTILVIRDMMGIVMAGLVLGLGAAAIFTPVLRSLLVGIAPLDVPTFAAVAALVTIVALVAIWIPARRAGRSDLSTVLRAE